MFSEADVFLFKTRWQGVLTEEELARCLDEAKTGDILTAHLCAARIAAGRRAEEAVPKKEEKKKEGKSVRVPWQAYFIAASAALTPLGLAALALAVVPPLLYVFFRNTAPFWRDGNAVVWRSPAGPIRLKAYRVAAVFKDIHGMGPRDFANAVRAFAQAANGVWYDGASVYVLVKEGKEEEAKTALRRLGVVLGEEVAPAVPPKASPAAYIALALAPLVFAVFNPAVIPAVVTAVLATVADSGAALPRVVNNNRLLAALLKEDEMLSVAKTSQLSLRSAFLMWTPWPQFYNMLQKTALRSEWKAKALGSMWRLLSTEILHAVRTRVMNRAEQAYLVAGFVHGETAAFGQGAYKPVAALTFDLAEFTPFSFMLLPFDCSKGAVKAGVDDAGREVCFRFEDLASPHMVVVGKTGSGKTTWTQAVARQLAQRGVKVVAIDPHGHWQGAKINAKRHVPPLVVTLDDIDYVLDILRASGTAVYDIHYTVLYNAVAKCGGSVPLSALPECLLKVRDISNAWAVDAIYGRLLALSKSQAARPPDAPVAVVHTEGDASPGDVMRLITWLYYYILEAKRTCPAPPCPYRLFLAVDEAHVLMKHLDALVRAYREVRKFGVVVAAMTQAVRDLPRDVLENSGVIAVLAIDPAALNETAMATTIDPKVLERVAVESLPEERSAVIRFGGRAPIYVKLTK